MIKRSFKNFRLLVISISAGSVFSYMEFSQRVNDTVALLADSNSSKGLGFYITIHIAKYVALIFSLVAFTIFLKVIFKKDKN
ncbi:hypothetical protein [Polaribacter sp. P097]|uniref:hypothetical protein n=1 Tax=Polaribacter sp. P097 TaxID=3117398 RepID=UPI002FDF22D5